MKRLSLAIALAVVAVGTLGQRTQSLYVYVDDVDAHCAQARSNGATIIEEPTDASYGDRRYGAQDPEGHVWYFAAPKKRSGD